MSDAVIVSQSLSRLDVSPQLESYTKVIIRIDDETVIEVGDDTGRTMEINNPFGTQAMAQAILESLRGYRYQPYNASGTLLDPAAEIGDAASMRGIWGGIYTRTRHFSKLMKADISAPYDDEIDHEFEYESPERREFKRQIADVKASLIIANDRIDASVSQTGGNAASFGWSLTATSHKWTANGKDVMEVNASGLTVRGKVDAESGTVGGFTISASAIYNNIQEYGGSQSSGVYIGTNGIQLGQRFKVDPSGNVTASSMTLKGTITFLNSDGSVAGTMSAANLRSGAYSAYTNGSYWGGGASYGYNFGNAITRNTSNYPSYFTAGQIRSKSGLIGDSYLSVSGTSSLSGKVTMLGGFNFGSYDVSWQSKTINGTTIRYLGRA